MSPACQVRHLRVKRISSSTADYAPNGEKAAADVRDAINYVRSNADKYHVDKDRICLSAYSAGGPLLTLALHGDMPFVRCLVGFYSFMDIQQSDYAKTEKPETVKSFSPITYLETDASKIPPMFLACAGHDEVPTMLDSIDRFVGKALSANVALTLMNHPQGVHGFGNQNDDERSERLSGQRLNSSGRIWETKTRSRTLSFDCESRG